MSRFDERENPIPDEKEAEHNRQSPPAQPIVGEGFTCTDPKPDSVQGQDAGRGQDSTQNQLHQQPGYVQGGAWGAPPDNQGWDRQQSTPPTRNQYPGQMPMNPPGYQPPYSGASGWNQGPSYNYGGHHAAGEDGYKWNFEDYERAAQTARPKARKSSGIIVFASLLCAATMLGVALFAGYSVYNSMGNRTLSPGSTPSYGASTPSNAEVPPGISVKDKPEENGEPISTEGRLTTAQVAKKVSPSVVGIANYQGNNSFTASGEGSGIIMTEDGYIVTNAHVVEGAKGLTVVLNNGETYAGQVVGMDSKTDLAIIKIEANNLTYAEFGNSDQVEVGEDVVAIGNPSGMQLAGSVTKGIVSAVNRVVDGSAYSTPFIQTDAAINPGNSGGALVNEYGQVIGINSAKLVATDYEGIGFAIPINNAMPIIKELISNGRVTGRAELGLTGQMVDETLARFNGTPPGVGIIEVKPHSDLAKKNVVPGDIITKINDTPIVEFKTLTDVLVTKKPGDTVKLTIYRRGINGSGKSFDVNIILIEDDGSSR